MQANLSDLSKRKAWRTTNRVAAASATGVQSPFSNGHNSWNIKRLSPCPDYPGAGGSFVKG
jgi:hypothetical protein